MLEVAKDVYLNDVLERIINEEVYVDHRDGSLSAWILIDFFSFCQYIKSELTYILYLLHFIIGMEKSFNVKCIKGNEGTISCSLQFCKQPSIMCSNTNC